MAYNSLFLMQRYLGSDDEQETKENASSESKKEHKTDISSSRKRKQVIDQDTVSEGEIEICKETALIRNDECTKKKKKIKKKADITEKVSDLKNDVKTRENNAKSSLPQKTKGKKKNNLKESSEQFEEEYNDAKNTGQVEKTYEVKSFISKAKSKKIQKEKASKETIQDTSDRELFPTIGKVNLNIEKSKTNLLKWLENPIVIGVDLKENKTPVSEFPYLDADTQFNLVNAGMKFLFPVQSTVIPWLIQSNRVCVRSSDICVSAPTGSGKTLAFVIPIIQSLKNRVVCAVRALVVVPVTELAHQINEVFQKFVKGTDLKVVLLSGQKSLIAERHALVQKGINATYSLADIVVTTPGRILDHIHKTEGFCLQNLRYLVIDEADRMMLDVQQGWLKQVENAVYSDSSLSGCACNNLHAKRIQSVPPNACMFGYTNQPFQKLLYSATLTQNPEELHALSLYKPKLFVAKDESEYNILCSVPKELAIQTILCEDGTKPMILCHHIQEKQYKKVICFTETVDRSSRLQAILQEMGFLKVREISSNCTAVQRKVVMKQFTSGKINVVICSDLVARGMDIENVDCVISYDVPSYPRIFIHRIGRTARAGKSGVAIMLLTNDEVNKFQNISNSLHLPDPEKISIHSSFLQDYVDSFQKALVVADRKIKKLKNSTNDQMKRKEARKKFEKNSK